MRRGADWVVDQAMQTANQFDVNNIESKNKAEMYWSPYSYVIVDAMCPAAKIDQPIQCGQFAAQ